MDPERAADQGGSEDDGEDTALTPEQQALAEEAAEIRRLVDEGAGTPEAIRELAARLREHRAREEELWRTAVKPALVKEGKGRLRGHAKPLPTEPRSVPAAKSSQSLWVGLGVLGVVLVVIVAANTSVWVLLLPVIGLLVWAWYQGRDDTSGR
jgi:uncharacterized protein YoaH (UPF0181 family)